MSSFVRLFCFYMFSFLYIFLFYIFIPLIYSLRTFCFSFIVSCYPYISFYIFFFWLLCIPFSLVCLSQFVSCIFFSFIQIMSHADYYKHYTMNNSVIAYNYTCQNSNKLLQEILLRYEWWPHEPLGMTRLRSFVYMYFVNQTWLPPPPPLSLLFILFYFYSLRLKIFLFRLLINICHIPFYFGKLSRILFFDCKR